MVSADIPFGGHLYNGEPIPQDASAEKVAQIQTPADAGLALAFLNDGGLIEYMPNVAARACDVLGIPPAADKPVQV